MIASDKRALIAQGAEEALRREREHDPRVKGFWRDRNGQSNSVEEIEYKGCVITYPRPRMDSSRWTVNVASNDPHLLTKLGGVVVINDFESLDGAIVKAKRHVDGLY
jgi:hypothetical protein